MPVGKRIYLKRQMPDPKVVAGFKKIPASNTADCMERNCAMNPRIKLMSNPDEEMVGPAFTVHTRAGDNLAIYAALKYCQPGDVIVIDNEGGSSYRISPETSQIEEVRELCELPHEQDIARIAKAYGLKVLKAQDEDSLQMALKELYAPQDLPALLVVKTPAHMNGEVLRQYFQYMREA